MVVTVPGLAEDLQSWPADRYALGPVADALTHADQTTGPDGEPVAVEDRMVDMLHRHGPSSPNAHVHD